MPKHASPVIRGYSAQYDQGVRGNYVWSESFVFRKSQSAAVVLRGFVDNCAGGAILSRVNIGTVAYLCSYRDSHGLPSYKITWQRAGVVSDVLIIGYPAPMDCAAVRAACFSRLGLLCFRSGESIGGRGVALPTGLRMSLDDALREHGVGARASPSRSFHP